MKKVSIIIPCYNEEENIAECLRQIPPMGWDTEIVVADDGSTDRTAQFARESGRPFLKVVRQEQNLGKGSALLLGLRYATGDIVVILDADCTSPASEIPLVVEPIAQGRADFVNATRFVYPMERKAMKRTHILSNRFSAALISLFIGRRITDSLCGLKAFRREMLEGKLKEKSWPDFELLVKARRNGMRIAEVAIHYRARRAGNSKMRTSRGCYHMPVLLLRSLIRQ